MFLYEVVFQSNIFCIRINSDRRKVNLIITENKILRKSCQMLGKRFLIVEYTRQELCSLGSILYGTKWLFRRPHVQNPTLHSKRRIVEGIFKRGSTIDHCRSRCKGREDPPFVHSFIHARQELHAQQFLFISRPIRFTEKCVAHEVCASFFLCNIGPKYFFVPINVWPVMLETGAERHMGLCWKCQLYLFDFSEDWNLLTFSNTPQHNNFDFNFNSYLFSCLLNSLRANYKVSTSERRKHRQPKYKTNFITSE
jgi:hypothetical protein